MMTPPGPPAAPLSAPTTKPTPTPPMPCTPASSSVRTVTREGVTAVEAPDDATHAGGKAPSSGPPVLAACLGKVLARPRKLPGAITDTTEPDTAARAPAVAGTATDPRPATGHLTGRGSNCGKASTTTGRTDGTGVDGTGASPPDPAARASTTPPTGNTPSAVPTSAATTPTETARKRRIIDPPCPDRCWRSCTHQRQHATQAPGTGSPRTSGTRANPAQGVSAERCSRPTRAGALAGAVPSPTTRTRPPRPRRRRPGHAAGDAPRPCPRGCGSSAPVAP